MGNEHPVFKQNYQDYLQKLNFADIAARDTTLQISVNLETQSVTIPFLNTQYTVSPTGILDEYANRPTYGICVILLKYLLMCPDRVPGETSWIQSRDFKDTVQAQNKGLSDYAAKKISEVFSGNASLLKKALSELGGQALNGEFPYDLSVSLPVLPRVPILVLFNDKDEHFDAETFILYENRAHHFLDAECRVMVDWYLFERVKRLTTKVG